MISIHTPNCVGKANRNKISLAARVSSIGMSARRGYPTHLVCVRSWHSLYLHICHPRHMCDDWVASKIRNATYLASYFEDLCVQHGHAFLKTASLWMNTHYIVYSSERLCSKNIADGIYVTRTNYNQSIHAGVLGLVLGLYDRGIGCCGCDSTLFPM